MTKYRVEPEGEGGNYTDTSNGTWTIFQNDNRLIFRHV